MGLQGLAEKLSPVLRRAPRRCEGSSLHHAVLFPEAPLTVGVNGPAHKAQLGFMLCLCGVHCQLC